MQTLDIEHVLFWMDAIRDSDDRYRTLESFWKGQIKSKLWLIKHLSTFINSEVTVEIHGGWNGVLSSLLFQTDLPIKKITNIDIDSKCSSIARKMNQIELQNGKFQHCNCDMLDFESSADVVINTSCEHLLQMDYDKWLSGISNNSLLVLQSNNYAIEEHVRLAETIEEFKNQSSIFCYRSEELNLPLYTRWMLIGTKQFLF